MKDITSTITKPLAVLRENGKGYTKPANKKSSPKQDLREGNFSGSR